MAISEQLLDLQGTIFFSTHFSELQELLKCRPGVVLRHFQISNDEIEYTRTMSFKVADGVGGETQYGIKSASSTSLPRPILSKAQLISDQLKADLLARRSSSRLGKMLVWRKMLFDLHETLKQIDENSARLEIRALRSWLERLMTDLLAVS